MQIHLDCGAFLLEGDLLVVAVQGDAVLILRRDYWHFDLEDLGGNVSCDQFEPTTRKPCSSACRNHENHFSHPEYFFFLSSVVHLLF